MPLAVYVWRERVWRHVRSFDADADAIRACIELAESGNVAEGRRDGAPFARSYPRRGVRPLTTITWSGSGGRL